VEGVDEMKIGEFNGYYHDCGIYSDTSSDEVRKNIKNYSTKLIYTPNCAKIQIQYRNNNHGFCLNCGTGKNFYC